MSLVVSPEDWDKEGLVESEEVTASETFEDLAEVGETLEAVGKDCEEGERNNNCGSRKKLLSFSDEVEEKRERREEERRGRREEERRESEEKREGGANGN